MLDPTNGAAARYTSGRTQQGSRIGARRQWAQPCTRCRSSGSSYRAYLAGPNIRVTLPGVRVGANREPPKRRTVLLQSRMAFLSARVGE